VDNALSGEATTLMLTNRRLPAAQYAGEPVSAQWALEAAQRSDVVGLMFVQVT
jgi:hypothetical protein